MVVLFVQPQAEPVIEVFPETGWERLGHNELVIALPIRLSLGSQEEG